MKVFTASILLLLFVCKVQGQDCNGRYIKVINKNESVLAPCDKMFLLNAETFGRFYYASTQIDSLVILLPQQKEINDSLYKVTHEQMGILNEEIKLQNRQLDDRMSAIKRLENVVRISVTNNEDCIDKFGKLADKYRKEEVNKKRWRATSGILGGVSVVLLVLLIL